MNVDDLPLFSQGNPAPQSPQAWSVSQVTQKIRQQLEAGFTDLWIQGEVTNVRPSGSGHLYFSLKDDAAVLSAVHFGWARKKPAFVMKDGLAVLCHGKISVYPPRGSYQMIVDKIQPLGAGILQLQFEELKAKLLAEGLFDPSRKRPLPKFPKTVAVITASSGAALQDILTVMARRAPQVCVRIIPSLVQGDGAPKQLCTALEMVNRWKLADLILLARGGGSLEDLWCFNDEALARTLARSEIPVISAVGHEIDFTIADFVSDLRAPTPSAGAEMLSQAWVEALPLVRESSHRLQQLVRRDLQHRRQLLEHLRARLVSPRDRLREQMQRCDDLMVRLRRAIEVIVSRRKETLGRAASQLNALSPLNVLERGYAMVRSTDAGGRVIRKAAELQIGQEVELKFADGEKKVKVL